MARSRQRQQWLAALFRKGTGRRNSPTKEKRREDAVVEMHRWVCNNPGVPRREWPWAAIADTHGVPRQTLQSRYDQAVAEGGTAAGSPELRKQQSGVKLGAVTALKAEVEKQLAGWLEDRAKENMSVSQHLLHLKAAHLLNLHSQGDPNGPKVFNTATGRPSRSWWNGFKQRHDLVLRRVSTASQLRVKAEKDINRMIRCVGEDEVLHYHIYIIVQLLYDIRVAV